MRKVEGKGKYGESEEGGGGGGQIPTKSLRNIMPWISCQILYNSISMKGSFAQNKTHLNNTYNVPTSEWF